MGSSYVNHTVCSPDITAVIQTVKTADAFISQLRNGCVVIFDKPSEQSLSAALEVGKALSKAVNSTQVLTVMIHDDDVMLYWLHAAGEEVDTYDSNPGYMEMDDPPPPPSGGNSEVLTKAFGASGSGEVEAILDLMARHHTCSRPSVMKRLLSPCAFQKRLCLRGIAISMPGTFRPGSQQEILRASEADHWAFLLREPLINRYLCCLDCSDREL